MSLTGFRPLAAVTITDEANGKAMESLSFDPTAATAAKLTGHRLIFRRRLGGFQLYAERNLGPGGGPVVPIVEPVRLVFALRSSDRGRLARYKPSEDPTAGPNLYLTNLDDAGVPQASRPLSRGESIAAADSARIVGPRFRARVPLPATNRPNRVEVRRRHDGERVGDAIPLEVGAGASAAELGVDLSNEEASAFTLVPKPAGDEQHILVDEELAATGAYGAVELVLKPFPGPDPEGGREFTAVFARREPADPE